MPTPGTPEKCGGSGKPFSNGEAQHRHDGTAAASPCSDIFTADSSVEPYPSPTIHIHVHYPFGRPEPRYPERENHREGEGLPLEPPRARGSGEPSASLYDAPRLCFSRQFSIIPAISWFPTRCRFQPAAAYSHLGFSLGTLFIPRVWCPKEMVISRHRKSFCFCLSWPRHFRIPYSSTSLVFLFRLFQSFFLSDFVLPFFQVFCCWRTAQGKGESLCKALQ